MKIFAVVFVGLIALTSVRLEAQQQPGWVPQGVEALRQVASSKTEFTLDHSMLVFASKFDSDNEDVRRVIAGVSGLSVRSYHFSDRWMYDPDALKSVKQEYHAAGWKQLVNNREKNGPGVTELWVRVDHEAICDIAILVTRSTEVTFISISGSISPLDLSHLGGHFGIPKIEAGVQVPNTGERR